MRIVFVGAGSSTVTAAEILIERGHEVIVIESDRERIDALYDKLDCSFLHGDGSNPAILKEADPKRVDVLLCLTESDQANILASVVGRSLGFSRVITKITDPAYEPICHELALDGTIVPYQTIGRYLADMVHGANVVELSTVIRGDARFYSFVADAAHADRALSELDLPKQARVVCLYRDDEMLLPEDETRIREQDEIVILTYSKYLQELSERFTPKNGESEQA
ncbi:MAG: NAD-binding protein [Myxococcales bacterium]